MPFWIIGLLVHVNKGLQKIFQSVCDVKSEGSILPEVLQLWNQLKQDIRHEPFPFRDIQSTIHTHVWPQVFSARGLKYIIDAMEYHIKETLRHSVTLYRRSPFMYACVWNIKYKHLLATKEYPRPIWKQKIRNYSRQEFIHYSIFLIFI